MHLLFPLFIFIWLLHTTHKNHIEKRKRMNTPEAKAWREKRIKEILAERNR